MSFIKRPGVYQNEQDLMLFFQSYTWVPEISGVTSRFLSLLRRSFNFFAWPFIRKLLHIGLLIDTPIEDEPIDTPIYEPSNKESEVITKDINYLLISKKNWPYSTISDYHNAYKNLQTTPTIIAKRLIEICSSEQIQNYHAVVQINPQDVLIEAQKSTKRYLFGHPLSVVDGVPFFVKEHIKVKKHIRYFGIYEDEFPGNANANCVQKLIDKGALLIGTTMMVQLGTNIIGVNPSKKFPSPNNIWDNQRYMGGSSTGNAIVVGLGLCPFAIGSDGLGCIRVPAGNAGIVGLRPTYARVDTKGCCKFSKGSSCIAIGPMACCVADAAIVYHIISETNSNFAQIYPNLYPNFHDFQISKIRFGYYSEYLQMSEKSQLDNFNKVCELLKQSGCTLKPIYIPEINECYISVLIDQIPIFNEFQQNPSGKVLWEKRSDVALEFIDALIYSFKGFNYDIVKKQRRRSMRFMENIFNEVDVILHLTTSQYPSFQKPSHKAYGFIDPQALNHSAFYSAISSFTGIPSISINIGYDDTIGLPIAMQLMGKWWREDILLSVANTIENLRPLSKAPSDSHNILMLNNS